MPETQLHSFAIMSSDWRDICIGALICATLLVAIRGEMDKKKAVPLPPGPPPIPIIGNVRGIDVNAPWLTYTEWGKQYGAYNMLWRHFDYSK